MLVAITSGVILILNKGKINEASKDVARVNRFSPKCVDLRINSQ